MALHVTNILTTVAFWYVKHLKFKAAFLFLITFLNKEFITKSTQLHSYMVPLTSHCSDRNHMGVAHAVLVSRYQRQGCWGLEQQQINRTSQHTFKQCVGCSLTWQL